MPHREPLHPTGSCLLQAPTHPGPPPPLLLNPPLPGQLLPAPWNLTRSRGQPPLPSEDNVVLPKDEGTQIPPPPPQTTLAPPTCAEAAPGGESAAVAQPLVEVLLAVFFLSPKIFSSTSLWPP